MIAPIHRKARAPRRCSHPAETGATAGTGGDGAPSMVTVAGSGGVSGSNGAPGGGTASMGTVGGSTAGAAKGGGRASPAASWRLIVASSEASRSFCARRPEVRTSAMMAISGVPSAQAIPIRTRNISSTKTPGSPLPRAPTRPRREWPVRQRPPDCLWRRCRASPPSGGSPCGRPA